MSASIQYAVVVLLVAAAAWRLLTAARRAARRSREGGCGCSDAGCAAAPPNPRLGAPRELVQLTTAGMRKPANNSANGVGAAPQREAPDSSPTHRPKANSVQGPE